MKRGSNIVGVGAYNERLILSSIRRHGPSSKTELVMRTGLSKQALSDVVSRLENDGRLRREKAIRGKVGQPQIPFSLDPGGAYTIGLKVGRRSFEVVMVDFVGSIVAAHREVCRYPQTSALQTFLRSAWNALLAEAPTTSMSRVIGVGIAMPGELWRWSEEIDVPDAYLQTWQTFDLSAFVEEVTGLPTWIMNDVTSACIAEMMFGTHLERSDFLYYYIGSFVGGGLIIEDSVLLGRRSNAAALGSMLVGSRDECDPAQLLSRVSLIRLQRQLEAAGAAADFLWEEDAAWPEDNPVVASWLDEVAKLLAVSAINAVAVVDVPFVVIDGYFPANIRHRITNETIAAIAGLRTQGLEPPILAAGSLGYSARAVGAAALPMYWSLGSDRNALFK